MCYRRAIEGLGGNRGVILSTGMFSSLKSTRNTNLPTRPTSSSAAPAIAIRPLVRFDAHQLR